MAFLSFIYKSIHETLVEAFLGVLNYPDIASFTLHTNEIEMCCLFDYRYIVLTNCSSIDSWRDIMHGKVVTVRIWHPHNSLDVRKGFRGPEMHHDAPESTPIDGEHPSPSF